MSANKVKIIECPRDAMQGLDEFIKTPDKIRYINALLKVGFDTIDFGSFVSPKYIPQMKDTPQVLSELETEESNSDLLAIVANLRGAKDAIFYDGIQYIGYPFSISETFQKRNTNTSLEKSLETVEHIKDLCDLDKKQLVVYLSMAFGNPYGDFWEPVLVEHWVDRLYSMGIETISLSDTIGVATPAVISEIYQIISINFPDLELGAHFHSHPHNWEEKIDAAYQAGCRRFDGAIKGYGGCPFAKDDLLGNIATENLIMYFQQQGEELDIDMEEFAKALSIAAEVFPHQTMV